MTTSKPEKEREQCTKLGQTTRLQAVLTQFMNGSINRMKLICLKLKYDKV